MRTNLFLSILICAGVFLTSCNIEKRLYRPGYFVETSGYKQKPLTKQITNNSKNINLNETNTAYFKEELNLPTFYKEQIKTISNENNLLTAQVSVEKNSFSTQSNDIKLASKSEIIKMFKENNKKWPLHTAEKPPRGGKDQIIALLLCFFLGYLGIHSFYLGNTTKGIIQLVMFLVGWLTFFLFIGYIILVALGIWVLVDFIRIIIGDLGPGW